MPTGIALEIAVDEEAAAEHPYKTEPQISTRDHDRSRGGLVTRAPVALIPGAAHGIGAAVAHRLTAHGYALALLDRDRSALYDLSEALPSATNSVAVTVDVRDADQIDEAVTAAADRFSGVDGVTRNLDLDYDLRGVRVNAVASGGTRTRLVDEWLARHPNPDAALATIDGAHPPRRIEPGEIANVITFLLSEGASAITEATIANDCGLSLPSAVG